MKQIIIGAFIFAVLLTSCQSPDGKYLIYQSTPKGYPNDLDQNLIGKYGSNRYVLSFADKYVKITKASTNVSLVLAKQEGALPGADIYHAHDIEGEDSVRVKYDLSVDSKDVILTVSASRKNHKPYLGDEASVDFYLSKTKD